MVTKEDKLRGADYDPIREYFADFEGLQIVEPTIRDLRAQIVRATYPASIGFQCFKMGPRAKALIYQWAEAQKIAVHMQEVQYLSRVNDWADLSIDTRTTPIPQIGEKFKLTDESMRISENLGMESIEGVLRDEVRTWAANEIDIRLLWGYDAVKQWMNTGKTAPGLANFTGIQTVASTSTAGTPYAANGDVAHEDILNAMAAFDEYHIPIDGKELVAITTERVAGALSGRTPYDNTARKLIKDSLSERGITITWKKTPYVLGIEDNLETTANGEMYFIAPHSHAEIIEFNGLASADLRQQFNHDLRFDITWGGILWVPENRRTSIVKVNAINSF